MVVTLDCLGAQWSLLCPRITSWVLSGDLVRWETAGLVNGCWARSDGVCPEREEPPKVPTHKRNDEFGKIRAPCGEFGVRVPYPWMTRFLH